MCTSDDPRNRRTRHGLLLEDGGRKLLVDTPPELRLQLVAASVDRLDAVFITHAHADHVHGIDDLRAFTTRAGYRLPVFLASEYEQELRTRFAYFWGTDARSSPGTTVPGLDLVTFEDRDRLEVAGMELDVVAFPHGWFRSYGFRVGDLAVIVDAKEIPDDAVPLLRGVRVLVINALWYGHPHPTHFNVEEAVEVSRRLEAGTTYLTHLTHRLDHADLEERLPAGVKPASDGLTIEI
ncbi:MAG: MBL fold metallo-hydrolase [Candidatus Palauibacterales bacterium]|nr:MBL fold metallo-hydrolase [Candidatus Palauibacterales bacterium]MDP2483141.1 MBL fold metallo-hydrolase [Candidatus Palauibacterales bacterium]